MLNELGEIIAHPGIHDIKEIAAGRKSPYRQLIREVLHKRNVSLNPKTPKPQIINQNLSEIKKCVINICKPSKRMALYDIKIIAQQFIS